MPDTVTEKDLVAADVRTTEGDVQLLEEIKDTDTFRQVRGTNPNTGASPGLVLHVANDDALAKLAMALRTMPTGSFQAVNGDLRTVEASCAAATYLTNLFGDNELAFRVVKKKSDEEAAKPEAEVKADSGRPTTHPDTTKGTADKAVDKKS